MNKHSGQELSLPNAEGAVGQPASNQDLPPIYVTTNDERRLRAIASSRHQWLDEEVREFLLRELDRAVICSPDEVAPDVVTMNSRVMFRRQAGEGLECRTLVYDDAAIIGPSVSVFTPLGAALLGLRSGSRMLYKINEDHMALLVVEEVPYQPEAHGRHRPTRHRRWARIVGEK